MPRTRADQANGRRALFAYAGAWLTAAAVVVAAVAVVWAPHHHHRGRAAAVSVPPVRETQLGDAARRARCVLKRTAVGEGLNPPVDGPAGLAPARAGVYARPVPRGALTAALRHGTIAIEYRGAVGAGVLHSLRQIQSAAPTGTILAPNGTRMPYALAASGFRRLLACSHATPAALDAIQLFRGRFVGRGPEAG